MSEQFLKDRKTIWEQIVEKKEKFIGKILVDTDFNVICETKIKDITLTPNGDSYFFAVKGENFNCGFDIKVGGVSSSKKENEILRFSTLYSGDFYIK